MSEHAPAVLVHGNPETDEVWDALLTELGPDDVVRLSPPLWAAADRPVKSWTHGYDKADGRSACGI